jgi:hypothetical protein
VWRAQPSAPDIPPVDEADALGDRLWFGEHPKRSFPDAAGR